MFATLLNHFSELSHSATVNSTICYSTQPFYDFARHFCYSGLGHFGYSELICFVTVLNYFMILSVILKILSDMLLQCSVIVQFCWSFSRFCQPFCKIAQSYSSFYQPFFRMTNTDSRDRSRLMVHRGGAWGHVRVHGQALIGSIGWLHHWVQVMDHLR
jgi:hypothetical protein